MDDFEAHFEALNAHLAEVRPMFDRFCKAHHFDYAIGGLGRYPRIRIERVSEITIWLELMIDLVNGRYPEQFEPSLTYGLSAGGLLDIRDDPATRNLVRYSRVVSCFKEVPFSTVPGILYSELERGLAIIERWSVGSLKQDGERQEVVLSRIV